MAANLTLEIAVESAAAALAAERGGDRIELCMDLRNGGVTPRTELMQETRSAVKIPIHVMIRPRVGNFVYSAEEITQMRKSIVEVRDAGMNGIVLGVLGPNTTTDVHALWKRHSIALSTNAKTC